MSTESFHLSKLLLPELQNELASTRKMIEALPDGESDFKPHEKSSPLASLAGHMVGVIDVMVLALTEPHYDFGLTQRKRLVFESRPQLLAEFHERADKVLTAVKNTSDAAFHDPWKLTYHNHPIFSGERYMAYRTLGVNHMIHHRSQLGVYLRLLNLPVPSTFGPTADEPFKL